MSDCLNDEVNLDNYYNRGKIGFMEMPDTKQDIGPSVAELARYMQDFRQEFRHFGEAVVRKDVYTAERASLEAQVQLLRTEFSSDRNERRGNNNKILFSILVAGLSLLGNIVTVVLR
jgi:hypothetical protein